MEPFSIDKNALLFEMVVAKNVYKSTKRNQCSKDLIKIVKK